MTATVESILSTARSQLGYEETGGPSGHDGNLTKYWAELAPYNQGQPWCFVAGTLISTPDGLVPIEALQVGDLVLSASGVPRQVRETNARTSEVLVLSIHGAETVTTAEHPYWARRRTSAYGDPVAFAAPEWVPAGELHKGDRVCAPVPGSGTAGPGEALAWLVGYWLADGGFRKDRGTAMLYPGAHKAERVLKELDRAGLSHNEVERRTNTQIGVGNAFLSLLAGAGTDAYDKQVPATVWAWSREDQAAVLDGYLYGDGHTDANGRTRASTVSRPLAYSIAALIRAMGMPPSVRRYERADSAIIEGRTVAQQAAHWEVCFTVTGDDPRRVFHEVLDDGIWTNVKSVEAVGSDTVYNLSVEDEHTFIADGFAVHNCAAFQRWVDIHAGGPDLPISNPYYCPNIVTYAKTHGLWSESGHYLPADIILFDWNGQGVAEHVGRVESDNGSVVTTIEGNAEPGNGGDQSNGGGVYRRQRAHGSMIMGVLSYDKLLAHAAAHGGQPPRNPVRGNPFARFAAPCQQGATGDRVKFVQWACSVPVDGSFGGQTAKAVALFQRYHGLAVDAIVGPQTLGALRQVTH